MKVFKLLVLLIAFVSFTGCVRESGGETDGANISVGDKLPGLSIEMADGKKITNQDVNGKVSVIMLFTTTCPDCQKQFKAVEDLYREYKNDDRVILFGISRSDGKSSVSKYWENNGLTFPYSPQENSNVYKLFASSIVPRIYISDQSQTVRYMSLDNPLAKFEELKDVVESLLTE